MAWRIAIVIALCLLVLPLTAEGAQIFEKVGTLGGQSLKMGVGARANAMGDSYVAIADDASAGVLESCRHLAPVGAVHHPQSHRLACGRVVRPGWAMCSTSSGSRACWAVNVRALTMSRDIVGRPICRDGNGETFDAE
jgi:hypothetical protein